MERKIRTERKDGVTTTFYYLNGPEGTVQFMLVYIHALEMYLPMDAGFHSRKPLYEGHDGDACSVLDGDTCYFAPNYHGAEAIREAAASDPEEVWTHLQRIYDRLTA